MPFGTREKNTGISPAHARFGMMGDPDNHHSPEKPNPLPEAVKSAILEQRDSDLEQRDSKPDVQEKDEK
jgi:hypothetical protein